MQRQIRQRLKHSPVGPTLRKVHSSLVYTAAISQTWLNFGQYHAAPIDPFRVLKADPSRITKMFDDPQYFEYPVYVSEITGGDWNRATTDFESYDLYRSFESHFKYGAPWSETPLYYRVAREARRDDWSKWGCDDMTDFVDRLEELDRLYERIKQYGYKNQRDLYREQGPAQAGRSPLLSKPPELFEVTVVVGPDGDMYFHYQGRHRLSIAKILNLDLIPVRVRARHSEWQRVRNDVARGRQVAHDTSHPDLQYL